ncbi:hypothetical protein BFP72_05855 [Reichenbachiella sp. 5M10]|nr:hypothetical protein BFP72_05855 [Reichenbachiella sp. 5M10]
MLLNITLLPETLQLKEVVVNAQNEDPAYSIIRQTIRHKKKFQEEINAFHCQVYMKGLQRLDEKPDRILGVNIPIDTGIVYLSESVSELSFHKPDLVQEKMISSKVSGDQSAFSFNQASQTLVSIYDNLLAIEGISERGYVSPVAKNALFFYEYKLEGIITEGDYMINKIKVIPRRKTDPTFQGYLYIIEDLWRISSFELTLTKEHQLEFLDTLTFHQVHAPIIDSTWVMLSQNFEFYLNTFGFKGSGYFAAVYSDYQVELNPDYISPVSTVPATTPPTSAAPQYTAVRDTSINKRAFKNEILAIEKGSNKRSDDYWSTVRPVPLTAIERQDYATKDSISAIKNTKHYRDSVDRISNKLTLGNVLLSGYRYQNSYKAFYIGIPSILQTLQFNTVEGVVFNLKATYTQNDEDNMKYRISPQLRYGLASQHLYGRLDFDYSLNPKKMSDIHLGGGHFVSQFNPSQPISPLINSLETLLNRRNYLKLYEQNFFYGQYTHELINGLFVKPSAIYTQRKQLNNESDYSLFYKNSREFTSNQPKNISDTDTSFPTHEALIVDLEVQLRFGQKYISMPNKKIIVENKYPKVKINYTKGLPWLGSVVDYDRIKLEVDDDFALGLWGTSEYTLGAGKYILGHKQMEFMDYQHFNTNASILARFEDDYFQLLDYYYYSTNDYWAEAHFSHHFNGFIINKLPLIRKSKVQTVASAHFLHTDALDTYVELGIGLEHIFKLMRFDYFTSFEEGKFRSHGFRLGMGF